MILIKCLGHSGFSVESSTHFLIFDYSEGDLPNVPKGKKTYVFVSHSHYDHFNENIFSLSDGDENIKYILSYDIERKIRSEKARDCNLVFVSPEEELKLDGKLKARVLRSTDCGCAFLVNLDGRNIFHAGDLHLWLWDGMSENEQFFMIKTFREYTKELKNFKIDTAFLPLDNRQEMYSFLGISYYMNSFRISHAIPMHFFGPSDIVDRLKAAPVSRSFRDKLIKMEKGDEISLI